MLFMILYHYTLPPKYSIIVHNSQMTKHVTFNFTLGSGEMAQRFRALSALPKS